MFKPVDPKPDFPEMEKRILDWWYKEGVVEKYLHKNDNSKERFSFLDGPITANNPMGVHHAWGRTYKDLWQRFYNLRGYKQRFQNGFDCQGLWVEVEVEKELGLKTKKDIENLIPGDKKASIAKFVNLCKERVIKYSTIQTEQSKRLGYFMNWDHSYYTMSDENNYMIWHFLKVCHEKGWIYKGADSVPWCPRCETAISQHEMLTEDYKELTHETVFLKLPITTKGWENTFLLVWTTTPWTILANVAVGINIKYIYGVWENPENGEKIIIIDKDENGSNPMREWKGKQVPVNEYIFNNVETHCNVSLQKTLKGSDLLGLKYAAPFDFLPRVMEAAKQNPQTFHTVVDGSEIVVSNEGTGLLHVAPGAGQEDFQLGKKTSLPVLTIIDEQANYLDGLNDFSAKNAKKHPEIIIDFLNNLDKGRYLLKTLSYTHRYPACWRCKTELVWRVADEWYISMDKKNNATGTVNPENKTLRETMIEVAKQINWHPEFGLERELDWLSNMHDWLISKPNRYWGLALPIYECKKCGSFEVIGSREELKEKAAEGWEKFDGHSPHKPWVDEVKIKCPKCGEMVERLPDVGNVWLDAGIVPYSTLTDPKTGKVSFTSDKKYWEEWFPADFITESFPGQFKNWFYAMIAESAGLTGKAPYKTVLGFGTLLGEDGRPMHKSWGNAIGFYEGADKIGVDVMRWMFMMQNPEANMLFGYKNADETRRRFYLLLWNVYNFFITYALADNWQPESEIGKISLLDQWVLTRLNETILEVTGALEKYTPQAAAVSLEKFVNDFSTWYIRRTRDRIGPAVPPSEDKNACYYTLYTVLTVLCRVLSPFIPFLTEEMYRNLTGELSVHLSEWPHVNNAEILNKKLISDMSNLRDLAALVHARRKSLNLKVRQPLPSVAITTGNKIDSKLEYLLKDELNIKNIQWKNAHEEGTNIELDTNISEELKAEGETRELIRRIQEARKKSGCGLTEKVTVSLPSWPKQFTDLIQKETLAEKLIAGDEIKILK